MLKYNKDLKLYSRELRKQMTDAERLLWRKIRKRQIKDLQFYRQRPIGDHIVDFYCPKAKLIVEIDGGQHYEISNEKKDKIRDRGFKSSGLKVLRFQNIDILKNMNSVVRKIWDEVEHQFSELPSEERRRIFSLIAPLITDAFAMAARESGTEDASEPVSERKKKR